MSTLATTALKNPSSGINNISLGTDGSTTLTTARMTTLADSAGADTSTPAQIASGRAKAWVNFNGTGTVAIRAQYNVSSITDNGVGDYTVNLTTPMADANYSVTGTAADGANAPYLVPPSSASFLPSSVRIACYNYLGNLYDTSALSVAIFR